MVMKDPQSILITGASSGIGEALALEYSGPGVLLALCGRDGARLDAVAERCRNQGAAVEARVLDVTDRDALRAWIAQVDSARALDLVVANAGISGGAGGAMGESETQARTIFEVNFNGVLNTLWPAIDAMRGHAPDDAGQRGHIAILGSLAGLTPLPGAPAYSASKAAVKAYGEALNGALRDQGIVITTVCPGFIKSRITDQNDFPMPFFLQAPEAARLIRRGLAKKRISVFFPWPLAAATWAVSVLPPCWRRWILSRAPKKS